MSERHVHSYCVGKKMKILILGFARFMLVASWPFDSLVDVVISRDLAPSYYLIYSFSFIVICCLVQLVYVLVLPFPTCIIVAYLPPKTDFGYSAAST